jgi:redox-sensitive bicupin YhaK (pirin superfamily)
LQTLVVPQSYERAADELWIHQNAWFYRGIFDEGTSILYPKRTASNGLFAIVIEGNFQVDGVDLNRRDALGIKPLDRNEIGITAQAPDSELLLIEIPMYISN